MTSQNTTTARAVCKFPGCGQPAAPATGPGRPPEYCEGRGHTKVTAWRERRRLAAAEAGTTTNAADTEQPVTMARVTGAELLRSLRAEADRIAGIADRLREAIITVTDPTAAEVEVEAVRAAAEQRATTAESRAAAAEQRAAEADQFRAEADAAAEEMGEHLAAAQTCAREAETARAEAEAERDAVIEQTRREAAERDTTIERVRAEADRRVTAAGADRDLARQAAADAETTARRAQQEATRAQAAEAAARAETERARADAERMLTQFRGEAARERDELRADLQARAERANGLGSVGHPDVCLQS